MHLADGPLLPAARPPATSLMSDIIGFPSKSSPGSIVQRSPAPSSTIPAAQVGTSMRPIGGWPSDPSVTPPQQLLMTGPRAPQMELNNKTSASSNGPPSITSSVPTPPSPGLPAVSASPASTSQYQVRKDVLTPDHSDTHHSILPGNCP